MPIHMIMMLLLLSQSESYILQAIQMALLPTIIYHKMQQVFSLFEEGKLKGQKERKNTHANRKRALEGQYSAKLFHFKPFQGLNVSILA